MKRSDLKVGEHYAYKRGGTNAWGQACEVELLSLDHHVYDRETQAYVPGEPGFRYGSRGNREQANVLVRRVGAGHEGSAPFTARTVELVATWAEWTAAKAAKEASDRAAALWRQQQRDAYKPTGNAIADRLVAAGWREDDHDVRQLREGNRQRLTFDSDRLAELLGIEVAPSVPAGSALLGGQS